MARAGDEADARGPRGCSTGCRARGSRARSRCTIRRRPGGSPAPGRGCRARSRWMRSASTRSASSLVGRRLGADAGAGDLPDDLPHRLGPVDLHGSQVVPRVAEVEGLVDQREVGNDVADHRVLEHRPVLPRRVVAVAAPDAWPRPAASSSSATKTSPRQPSTQPAPTDASLAAGAARVRCSPAGSAAHDRADQAQRFEQLVEAHRDARRDVAVAVASPSSRRSAS